MGFTDRRRDLLATERWHSLRDFIDRWYARPLSNNDGHTPLEIAQTEQRLGMRLPNVLTEWFELVGRRLRSVQDAPQLLDKLTVNDQHIRVWDENQGVWSIITSIHGGDDPLCIVDDDAFASPNAPLSRTLLGMLVSDSIVGAWSGQRHGPVGELSATVRGGYVADFTDQQVQLLQATYDVLHYSVNPFFNQPYRGSDETIIRFSGAAVEWMTATNDAFTRFNKVVELAPFGGSHVVVVAFEGLNDEQWQCLSSAQGVPNPDLLDPTLKGVGHIGMMKGGALPRFHINTKEPYRVAELVLAALRSDLLPHVTIASRPAAISVYEVLYPLGKTEFAISG
jgi:hypothetical protein